MSVREGTSPASGADLPDQLHRRALSFEINVPAHAGLALWSRS
jgi:hypothetical protein